MALTERDGDALHIWIRFENLIAECAVFLAVEFTGFDVHIDCDFQRLLHIFLVGNRHINVLGKFPHDLAGLFAVFPEVFTVI